MKDHIAQLICEEHVRVECGLPSPRQKKTCENNAAGGNSSFIFTVCVKSVPLYYFKLACVVLQMAVKEFFETHV